jgi:hypothetical protein
MTIDTWLSAANGDPSGFWFMGLVAKMAFPESFVWGELAAMGRADTLAAKRYFAAGPHRSDSILGNPGTEFLYAGGGLIDAWPAEPDENEYATVRDSNVPTLLIGGTLDFTTPPVNATRDLLPHLPNGRQVVLAELGHSTSFWTYEPKASTRLLNTFLDTGKVDTSLYTPAKVDFTPDVTHTALGKGFAGTVIGLPIVALLSLLLMRRRVRRRGKIGRTLSVLLRSLFTGVLGFAGWFAGVVVVLAAFRDVPLDDAALAILSIGSRSASESILRRSTATGRSVGGSRSCSPVPSSVRGSASRPAPGFSLWSRPPSAQRSAGTSLLSSRTSGRASRCALECAPPRRSRRGPPSRDGLLERVECLAQRAAAPGAARQRDLERRDVGRRPHRLHDVALRGLARPQEGVGAHVAAARGLHAVDLGDARPVA